MNFHRIPKPTDNFVELTSLFAVSTGIIAADLQQIPNQPVVFMVKKNKISKSKITFLCKKYRKIPRKRYDLMKQ